MTAKDGFLIHPMILTETGSIMSNVVFEMNNAAVDLRQDMAYAHLGPGNEIAPWGTDEIGDEFGSAFTDTVASVWPSVESYRHQIEYGAKIIFGAAVAFQDLTLGGATAFQGIGGLLPGGLAGGSLPGGSR
jgi:hypothetical protein